MAECASSTCEREAIMAVASRAPEKKQGLVTTVYQFEEDAPAGAPRYCGPCGVRLAAGLAALADADLRVTTDVTSAVADQAAELGDQVNP